jgi:hypothetical protein
MTESSTCGWLVSEPIKSTMGNALLRTRLGWSRCHPRYRAQVQQALQRAFTFHEWYTMVRRSFIRSAHTHRGGTGRMIATRVDKNVVIVR